MTHEMKDEKYRMKETKLIDWCIKKILVFQQRNREKRWEKKSFIKDVLDEYLH